MGKDEDKDDMRLRLGNLTKAKEILEDYKNGRDLFLKLPLGWAVRFAAQIVADHEKAEELEMLKVIKRYANMVYYSYTSIIKPNEIAKRLLAKGFLELINSDEVNDNYRITEAGKKELS